MAGPGGRNVYSQHALEDQVSPGGGAMFLPTGEPYQLFRPVGASLFWEGLSRYEHWAPQGQAGQGYLKTR